LNGDRCAVLRPTRARPLRRIGVRRPGRSCKLAPAIRQNLRDLRLQRGET